MGNRVKENIKTLNIPAVILCGGKGTRMGQLAEEIPKPLIPVGGKPILWHIMKIYASQGVNDFILTLGEKGEKIREYFQENNHEGWKIHFADTGKDSSKSERLMKIKELIKGDQFFLAYGDDVADINLANLLEYHRSRGVIVTITAVRMRSPFGIIEQDKESGLIEDFKEKPRLDVWMNGGFMVVTKELFDYLAMGSLEDEVFSGLVKIKRICAYNHEGGWKSMNTLKDVVELNALWEKGDIFWKTWR